MRARNRRTGKAIVGTLERVYGRSGLLADGFRRTDDGELKHEYDGQGIEILWDCTEQNSAALRSSGDTTTVYIDADEEQVLESEIELHEDEIAPPPRLDTQGGRGERPPRRR